jgi:hypothetical protein
MKQHRTDLLALLFGLAFSIAGTIVIVTQATSIDVSPAWGAAVGLIVLGVVALAATVTRAANDSLSRVASGTDDGVVSSEEPTG